VKGAREGIRKGTEMSDDAERREHIAYDLAAGQGWDNRPRLLMQDLRAYLHAIKDHGTHVDSGGGDGTGDLWVTVGGVEYFVTVRLSNNQIAKDAGSPQG
jgi:hypothetical protein